MDLNLKSLYSRSEYIRPFNYVILNYPHNLGLLSTDIVMLEKGGEARCRGSPKRTQCGYGLPRMGRLKKGGALRA